MEAFGVCRFLWNNNGCLLASLASLLGLMLVFRREPHLKLHALASLRAPTSCLVVVLGVEHASESVAFARRCLDAADHPESVRLTSPLSQGPWLGPPWRPWGLVRERVVLLVHHTVDLADGWDGLVRAQEGCVASHKVQVRERFLLAHPSSLLGLGGVLEEPGKVDPRLLVCPGWLGFEMASLWFPHRLAGLLWSEVARARGLIPQPVASTVGTSALKSLPERMSHASAVACLRLKLLDIPPEIRDVVRLRPSDDLALLVR